MSEVVNHNSLQVRLQFGRFFSLALCISFFHLPAYSAPRKYAKSLSLYSAGKTEESYPLFESVFEDQASTPQQKLGAAMVLAYAPQSLLKQKRRQDYALYALENQKQLTDRVRLNLIRIVADGYFNDRDFLKAEKFYKDLASDADLRNQAYGEYRLGWIDLNQQKAPSAFQRWALFVQKYGNTLQAQDLDLFKSIILDSGRAWAEAAEEKSKDLDFLSLIPIFSQYQSLGSDFEEGVVLALKRYNRPEILEAFRKDLEKTPYYAAVTALLLKKKMVFEAFPCEIARWQASPSSEVIGYVNQCAKKVVDKKECSEPDGILIQDYYEKFDLKEKLLLPRISLSVSCKKWVPACMDFLDLSVQTAELHGSRVDTTTIQAMYDSCSNLYEHAPVTPEAGLRIRNQTAKLLDVYSEKNLFQGGSKDQVYSLSAFLMDKDSGLKALMIQAVLAKPLIYKETILPEILIEAMTSQEKIQYGIQFLTAFRKIPFSSVQLALFEQVIQDKFKVKDLAAVESLLQQFAPMSEEIVKSEILSGFWEYYWLELDETSRGIHQSEVEGWFKLLKIESLSSEKRIRVFGLALQYDLIPLVWSKWSVFSKTAQSKPELLKVFYQKTTDLLEKGSISADVLNSYSEGKILVRLQQNDPTLTSREVKKVLGANAAFKEDLGPLDQIRAISAKLKKSTLRLNGYLPDVLKSKMKSLQQEEKILVGTGWSNEKYLETAKGIFVKDASQVVQQLQNVQAKANQNPEMKDFSAQLSEIIKGIEEQIARESQ